MVVNVVVSVVISVVVSVVVSMVISVIVITVSNKFTVLCYLALYQDTLKKFFVILFFMIMLVLTDPFQVKILLIYKRFVEQLEFQRILV